MSDRPFVLVTEPLAAAPAAWLAARAEVGCVAPEDERFARDVSRADGLVVRTGFVVSASWLDTAPLLRVIGRAGVGLDTIDVAACRARGTEVVYTPEANTQAVVEYVICLALDALRPRVDLHEAVDTATWRRLRLETTGLRQLGELTVGVLGLGRIGRRVAGIAAAFGARVIFHDTRPIPPAERGGATPVDAATLFESSDLLTIHVDGRPSNRGFVGPDLLDRLRADAILVNTARGFVVDNEALRVALDRRPDARAILDVHEPEPVPPGHPLLGLPNARLLPHLASRTRTATANMAWVVRDVVAVLEGRAPRWPAPAAS